jgi:hypothetical protein
MKAIPASAWASTDQIVQRSGLLVTAGSAHHTD